MSDEALYLNEMMFYRTRDNWNPYESNKKTFKLIMQTHHKDSNCPTKATKNI